MTPEGGFFLAQDFDLEQYEQQVKDLEMIDRDRDVGAEHEQRVVELLRRTREGLRRAPVA